MRSIALVLFAIVVAGAASSFAVASATDTSITREIENVVRTAVRQPEQKSKPPPPVARERTDRLGRNSTDGTPAATQDERVDRLRGERPERSSGSEPSVRESLGFRRKRARQQSRRRDAELGRSYAVQPSQSRSSDGIEARREAYPRAHDSNDAAQRPDRLRRQRAAKRAQKPRERADRLRGRP
jgi:hypothetical protein